MKKVFVNGTFDVLHPGDIELLEFAKTHGDLLTVAIDSDIRVQALKGSGRPINNQHDRATMLYALRSVDYVVIFDTDQELYDMVALHEVMVKGSDYRGRPVIGEDVCNELIFFERIDGYSTTKTIQHIIDRR